MANPIINFSFGRKVSISQVSIGFNNNGGFSISLPKSVTINGKVFLLKGTEVAAGKRGYINFSGPFVGSNIVVTLNDNDNSKFIFVDEVLFTPITISGITPWGNAHTVTCENLTQNKKLVLPTTSQPAWDCEKAGLSIKSGEKVK